MSNFGGRPDFPIQQDVKDHQIIQNKRDVCHKNVEDQILRQRQTNWTAACIALAPEKQWRISDSDLRLFMRLG